MMAQSNGPQFLDPSIIANGAKPVEIESPIETMQRIERLKQLRLQNERLEQQNRQREAELRRTQTAAIPAIPAVPEQTTQQPVPVQRLSLKLLMGPEIFQLSGLDKLSPEQMALMDAWVTLYSSNLAKNLSKPQDK